MLALICLLAVTGGLSFALGFLCKNRALENEKKAVVNAELRMLDAQDRSSVLAAENRKLKKLLVTEQPILELF